MPDPSAINAEHYDAAYQSSGPLLSLLHAWVSYDQQSKSRENYAFVKPMLRSASKSGQILRVLDVGFGHGSFLLKFPAAHELYGCELSKVAVENFPRTASLVGKTVVTFSSERLSEVCRTQTFHIICLSHVLEHVENDRVLLETLVQSLAPGGKIIVNLPINEVWDDPKHVRQYTPATVRHLLESGGLTILSFAESSNLEGFLLTHKQLKQSGAVKNMCLKVMRLILGLLPLSWLRWLDGRIARYEYLSQHAVALAERSGAQYSAG